MTLTVRRILVGAALVTVAGIALPACGSDSDADSTTTSASDGSTSTTAAAGDDAGDDGEASGSESGGEYVDVCTLVTADEVAAIAGGPVTMEEDPGGGCSFDQEDLRAPSISFFSTDVGSDDTDGTFNEARVGAFGTLTDPTREEPGIGDHSAVASGTVAGGENQQGAGLTQVDSTLVQVTVVQGNGIDGAAVRAMVAQALTLAASKI